MSNAPRVVLFFGVILDPGVTPPAEEDTPGGLRIVAFPVGDTDAPRPARSYAVALAHTVRRGEEGCAMVADPHGSTFAPLPFNAAGEIRALLARHDLADKVDRTTSRLGTAEWLVAPVYG